MRQHKYALHTQGRVAGALAPRTPEQLSVRFSAKPNANFIWKAAMGTTAIVSLMALGLANAPVAQAQQVGLGTFTPDVDTKVTIDNQSAGQTNYTEALKIEGLPVETATPTDMLIINGNYVRSYPISSILQNVDTNTTNVSMSYDPATDIVTLTDSDGNTVTTDLSALDVDTNTTNSSMAIDGSNNLVLTDSAGAALTVDLSPYLDNVDTNTTVASLAIDGSNNLILTDSAGAQFSVDLTPYLDDTTLATNDLVQDAGENRIYNTNGQSLTFQNTGTADNLLVVDGANGRVGVGTAAPSWDLSITDADANGDAEIVATANGALAVIEAGNGSGANANFYAYNNTGRTISLGTNATDTFLSMTDGTSASALYAADGNFGINSSTPETALRVAGLTQDDNAARVIMADADGDFYFADPASLAGSDTNTTNASMAIDVSNVLTLTDSAGAALTVDLSPYLDNVDTNTTNVTMAIDGSNNLVLTDSSGNALSASLAPYLDNTDDFVTGAAFDPASDVLTISMQSGASFPVDLSDLADTFTDTNTTNASLVIDGSNVLTLTDSAGAALTVDLSPYLDNVDTTITNATAAIDGSNILTITDSAGGTVTVDLSPYLDDTTIEPWYGVDDGQAATSNSEDIYVLGKVGIGVTTPSSTLQVANPTVGTGTEIGMGKSGDAVTGYISTQPTWGGLNFTEAATGARSDFRQSLDSDLLAITYQDQSGQSSSIYLADAGVGVGTSNPNGDFTVADSSGDGTATSSTVQGTSATMSQAGSTFARYTATDGSSQFQINVGDNQTDSDSEVGTYMFATDASGDTSALYFADGGVSVVTGNTASGDGQRTPGTAFRVNGLTQDDAAARVIVSDAAGNFYYADPSAIGGADTNTTNATMAIDGSNVLTLTDSAGAALTVDLSPYLDNVDTNDFVTSAAIDGSNILTLTLNGGGTVPVDLSQLVDADTNTTNASMAIDGSNILTLTDSAGAALTVDLSPYLDNVDTTVTNASMAIDGSNVLTLTDSNGAALTVDLSPYLDDTNTFGTFAAPAVAGNTTTYTFADANSAVTNIAVEGSPWYDENTGTSATGQDVNVYMNQNVGIGDFSGQAVAQELVVEGEVRFGSHGFYLADENVIADFGNGADGANTSSAMTVFKDGTVHVQGNMMAASDRRLKTNITDWEDGLAVVMAMDTVTFDWKAENKPQGTQVGFIAQNVQAVLPEAVSVMPDAMGTLSVDNRPLIAASYSAIQALKAENDELQAENDAMQAQLDAMQAQMDAIMAMLEK